MRTLLPFAALPAFAQLSLRSPPPSLRPLRTAASAAASSTSPNVRGLASRRSTATATAAASEAAAASSSSAMADAPPNAAAGGDDETAAVVANPCPRLAAVREAMRSADGGRGVDAFIVPTEDPHMSEYPAPSDGRREWLTRFTGSAGTAVVTLTKGALLWTDGRYFLQAEKQLKGDEWALMKSGMPGVPEPPEWLSSQLPSGSRVGIDPALHTVDSARKLGAALERAGCELVPLDAPPTPAASREQGNDGDATTTNAPKSASSLPRHPPSSNPVDLAWALDDSPSSRRPDPPSAPARVHPALWAGEAASDKLARMRSKMSDAGASVLLVTALDEVAWLLNLRGGDVPHNPVFLSYVVVTRDSATLFVDEGKVSSPEVRRQLEDAGVAVEPYSSAAVGVSSAARGALSEGLAVWADPSKVSYALYRAAAAAAAGAPPSASNEAGEEKAAKRAKTGDEGAAAAAAANTTTTSVKFVERASPVTAAKALKNDAELRGMAEAHARDSVALAQTLRWLEEDVGGAGKKGEKEKEKGERAEATRESGVDEFVTAARARQPGFLEPSFPTIAGVGPNGAIIHYRAEKGSDSDAVAERGQLLLLDSGGQYDCGTTDVTRTVWLGASSSCPPSSSSDSDPDSSSSSSKPPEDIVEAFTRVLQGHIALDSAVFPEGTPGLAIDAFARSALWKAGLNYRHGTGHGVGAALNVHEGPQSISTRLHVHTPLDERMVVSNEPGFYEDGRFGIRIENLVAVERADTKNNFGGQRYFKFRKLTLAPLQRALIDASLLTDAEADWVDAYHASVRAAVLPRLRAAGDDETARWLVSATAPLVRKAKASDDDGSPAAAPVGGGGGGACAGSCVVETAPEPVGVGAK